MLSRVAESMYWMARYVERAENVARIMDANYHMILDLPSGVGEQWEPLVVTTADEDLSWIAVSLGLACQKSPDSDTCALLDRLGTVREFVAAEFDALLHDGESPDAQRPSKCKGCGPGPLPVDSEALLERLPAELSQRLRDSLEQPRVKALRSPKTPG